MFTLTLFFPQCDAKNLDKTINSNKYEFLANEIWGAEHNKTLKIVKNFN